MKRVFSITSNTRIRPRVSTGFLWNACLAPCVKSLLHPSHRPRLPYESGSGLWVVALFGVASSFPVHKVACALSAETFMNRFRAMLNKDTRMTWTRLMRSRFPARNQVNHLCSRTHHPPSPLREEVSSLLIQRLFLVTCAYRCAF
jgi:hypothetical protein